MIAPLFCREESSEREVNCLVEQMKETEKNIGVKKIVYEGLAHQGVHQISYDEQQQKDRDNIRTKLRTVGRLLKHLNIGKPLWSCPILLPGQGL